MSELAELTLTLTLMLILLLLHQAGVPVSKLMIVLTSKLVLFLLLIPSDLLPLLILEQVLSDLTSPMLVLIDLVVVQMLVLQESPRQVFLPSDNCQEGRSCAAPEAPVFTIMINNMPVFACVHQGGYFVPFC
jgi:hypothetical protein